MALNVGRLEQVCNFQTSCVKCSVADMDTCLQLRALVAEKGNIHVTGTSNEKIYIPAHTLVSKQNTLKASS